jgi:RNA polymerase sigma factor (sigma-70 family)
MSPNETVQVVEVPRGKDPRSFEKFERQVRKLVRCVARVYAAAGAGEEDDLVQEGMITLASAFERFDGARANAKTYARGVLKRKYSKALRDAKRQKRVPQVWQETPTGRRLILCPMVSLDEITVRYRHELEDESAWPETAAIEEIDQSETIRHIMECLNPFQAQVLRLWLAPTAGLLATARNLTGEYTVQQKHIAIYLGVPASRVETVLKKVRALVISLDGAGVEES